MKAKEYERTVGRRMRPRKSAVLEMEAKTEEHEKNNVSQVNINNYGG